MRLVIIESPFAGDQLDRELYLTYLRGAMRDCLLRGESPYASHGLYTQPGVLRDEVPGDRKLGIAAGFAWRPFANATIVYTDLGISRGMKAGIAAAEELQATRVLLDHAIEYRNLNLDGMPSMIRQMRDIYSVIRANGLHPLEKTSPNYPWPWKEPTSVFNDCGPTTAGTFTLWRGGGSTTFAAGPTPNEPGAFNTGRQRFWVRCETCREAAGADIPFLHIATTSVRAQCEAHGEKEHGWMR